MSDDRGSIPFRRVAFVGLGVMGGSLARALAALPSPPSLVGWSPEASERRRAVESGAVHEAPTRWEDATADADLVVLAVPLRAVCDLLGPAAATAPSSAVIMDVASLKEPVRRAALAAGLHGRWVGCHPMCGSEASGFGASRVDLFAGATVWTVSEGEAEAARAVRRVGEMWQAVGARPRAVAPAEHDRMMTLVSHLPQLASNALARTVRERGVSVADLGPGGRDATRLAGSSPGMWMDILAHARPELAESLRGLGDRALELATLVEQGDIEAIAVWMSADRSWRADA
ncbi:MAG: prephenate dehydrogenase/arogenate dehydrogenase family protein [Gemmatimonadetes bacterium]|nr:prephenate dehydrogenase/arogenate dehydrogenase family protein [Gemmatimonadota bacterium]